MQGMQGCGLKAIGAISYITVYTLLDLQTNKVQTFTNISRVHGTNNIYMY